MISVICAHCGTQILVPPTVQGARGVCFACQREIAVPQAENPDKTGIKIDFEPGETIAGRYCIERAIGRGGMGVVYAARDMLVSEQVALKFMHPNKLQKPAVRAMFIREAQVARALRHEHIAAVHDVGITPEGALYLSMELLAGHSLRAFFRQRREDRKYLDVRKALKYMRQVLLALGYAHRTVFHRDMKPENIMLLPGDRLKVVDFGLARAVDIDVPEISDHTGEKKEKKMLGTAAYAAPEQRLHQEVDHRIDIYAAGLILRELLTLRTPNEDPPAIEAVRDDVPPEIVRVYRKAVAQDKRDRFATADQFLLAMEEASGFHSEPVAIQTDAAGAENRASTDGMIRYEGGSFIMGSDVHPHERPPHEVNVDPFLLDVHPVTNSQYNEYVRATNGMPPKYARDPRYNGSEQPVVGVSLSEANAYAQWAGKTLPSEAQWEFAARGQSNRKYPWGSSEPDGVVANFGENVGMPTIVGLHDDGATPEGAQDLAGNVYEWTRDIFKPYGAQTFEDEEGGARQACRGGAWDSPAGALRSAYRKGYFPQTRAANLGFRCAIDLSE